MSNSAINQAAQESSRVSRLEYAAARRMIRDNGVFSLAWMAPAVAQVLDFLLHQGRDELRERAATVAYCERENLACNARHTASREILAKFEELRAKREQFGLLVSHRRIHINVPSGMSVAGSDLEAAILIYRHVLTPRELPYSFSEFADAIAAVYSMDNAKNAFFVAHLRGIDDKCKAFGM